ncbi:MAG: hypothetical protein WA736_13425, partial [Candidatus Acidiferrum sp.]
TALGNQNPISTFPQPQQQQAFGYISNGSTTQPTVTFLDGLTRGLTAAVAEPVGNLCSTIHDCNACPGLPRNLVCENSVYVPPE